MIIQGDCVEVLSTLDAESVDALVSDPPAGISFMNRSWDSDKGGREEWVKWMSGVMRECYRVLKPGAHGLVWAIPRTSHWTATALEDAGFEIRDVITHLFGQGFPKSLDISKAIDKAAGPEREIIETLPAGTGPLKRGHVQSTGGGMSIGTESSPELHITAPATDAAKQWSGWGTALKPASEHWILVRKPVSEKNVASNVLKWGVGGINVDGCRVEAGERPFVISDRRSGNISYAYGEGLSGSKNAGVTAIGRFPANLVLSHTPYCSDDQCDMECAVMRLNEQSLAGGMHSAGKARDKGPYSKSGMFGSADNAGHRLGDSGGASRFFYCAKISPSERNAGLEDLPDRELRAAGGTTSGGKPTMKGRDRFGSIVKNNHPTVKPQKLMRYLCRLITPPGGVVLDPFMGSGSTGLAALAEGFRFIGIEREAEYCEIARKRIAAYFPAPEEVTPA